jgi:F-type H+-transporting ATPase subunit epsilon
MAGTFKFELVSPEHMLMSADAEAVVVSGTDGDFTVLAGHAPVISMLRPGIIDVTTEGKKSRMFVKSGFAEVDPERLTILADTAYNVEEMSASLIAEELAAAEEALAGATDDDAKAAADTLVSELKRLSGKTA